MGKIKVRTLGNEEEELKQKAEAKIKREEKIKRSIAAGKEAKIEEEKAKGQKGETKEAPVEKISKTPTKETKNAAKSKVKKHVFGKQYNEAQKKVSNKVYDLDSALTLLKKIKYAKFDETVEIHLNLKSQNIKGEVSLPHGTGKSVKVVIADEKVLEQIDKGTIDFEVLLTTPAFMPKLVKYARILGPKGLMPNPKNGTVTPDPEAAMKKFAGGTIRFKSESKFPLLHQSVGKSSFEEKQLSENIKAFIAAVGKTNIDAAFISTSMSPSIKLDFEKV